MIRKSRWNTGVSSLAALVAILVVACPAAEAQVKPFKVTGWGGAPTGLPLPGQAARFHWAVGHATFLGHYFGVGSVETLTANPQPNGTITGEFGSGSPFFFTGANGDVLACEYGQVAFGASTPGTFTLHILSQPAPGTYIVKAYWIAEFVPQPKLCSGKFAGVSESWIMYAQSEPFLLGSSQPANYSWEGEGSLTFQKAK